MDNIIEVIENINTFVGTIPAGEDLVVFEKGIPGTALVLYGFNEIGMFDSDFKHPTYGFTTNYPIDVTELGKGVNLGDVL